MGFVDIVFGVLLLYGFWKGLKKGFFVELASVLALTLGTLGSIRFSYITGNFLADQMGWDEPFVTLTAFTITFFTIVYLVHLSGKILTKIADFAMLGFLNKIAGAFFGMLKMAVIMGAILMFFDRDNGAMGLIGEPTKKQSLLYGPIKEIGRLFFSGALETEKDEVSPEEETEPKAESNSQ